MNKSLYNKNNKYFSGAGVLIVEDYFLKSGEIIKSIIVVQNSLTKEYSDFGGVYESEHSSIKNTAVNELREESCNLFNISKNSLDKYVDIRAGENYYRSYIVKINTASRDHFKYNLNLFLSRKKNGIHIPPCWLESSNITHIPIKNINIDNLNKNNGMFLKDIDNNNIKISKRLNRILYSGINVISDVSNTKAISDRSRFMIENSKCLEYGTYTFFCFMPDSKYIT